MYSNSKIISIMFSVTCIRFTRDLQNFTERWTVDLLVYLLVFFLSFV